MGPTPPPPDLSDITNWRVRRLGRGRERGGVWGERGGGGANVRIGAPHRVGGFLYHRNGDRWEWSDEVARIHGYEPDQVAPTTELMLSHKHPDDRRHVAQT